MLWLFLEL